SVARRAGSYSFSRNVDISWQGRISVTFTTWGNSVSDDESTNTEVQLKDERETVDSGKGTPVLPLRDVVVYPHMVIPLFVGRDKSIAALDRAMATGKKILLIAQQKADLDDPAAEDLYDVGTLATILQLLKLPDGTVKVLVEGVERARVDELSLEDHFSAEISILDEEEEHDEREIDVLVRSIIAQFEQYVKL